MHVLISVGFQSLRTVKAILFAKTNFTEQPRNQYIIHFKTLSASSCLLGKQYNQKSGLVMKFFRDGGEGVSWPNP